MGDGRGRADARAGVAVAFAAGLLAPALAAHESGEDSAVGAGHALRHLALLAHGGLHCHHARVHALAWLVGALEHGEDVGRQARLAGELLGALILEIALHSTGSGHCSLGPGWGTGGVGGPRAGWGLRGALAELAHEVVGIDAGHAPVGVHAGVGVGTGAPAEHAAEHSHSHSSHSSAGGDHGGSFGGPPPAGRGGGPKREAGLAQGSRRVRSFGFSARAWAVSRGEQCMVCAYPCVGNM